MTKQINKCSFCGRSEREVEMLLTGATGFICNDCVERAHEMIEEILKKNKTVNSGLGFTKEDLPRPQEIKKFLDQYVIGQDAAKRYLSVRYSIIINDCCRMPIRKKMMLRLRNRISLW